MSEDIFKKPDDLNAHNFKHANNFGGSSFCNWYYLMKHNGVFIGFNNHKWVVMFSSDPEAIWTRGCQESRALGDPRPQSKIATLINYRQIPECAKPLAVKWYNEAIQIARDKIREAEEKIEAKKLADKERSKEETMQRIIKTWEKAAFMNEVTND